MSQPTAGPSTPTSSPRRLAMRKSLTNTTVVPLPSPVTTTGPTTSSSSSSYSPSKRRRIEGPTTLGDPNETLQSNGNGGGLVASLKARRESQGLNLNQSLNQSQGPRSSLGERRKSRGSLGGSSVPGGNETKEAKEEDEEKEGVDPMSDSTRYNTRVEALNKAVDKFLELIDEAATAENFSTAVPQVSRGSLDPIRLRLISDLKHDLKSQHLEIVDDFNLNEKLRELQRMTEEADQRAADDKQQQQRRDTWQPDLDIENAFDAKGVEVQRENVLKVTQELEQTRAMNAQLYKELQDNMSEATAQQAETALFLDALDKAVASMRKQEETGNLKSRVDENLLALGDELGQRAS